MNFSEAANLVVAEIKRPDKLTTVKQAINEAIGFAGLRNFSSDLYETTVPINATQYSQRIDLTNVTYWIRFSRIKYIRPTGYRKVLTNKNPSQVFLNGVQAQDVWYHSGTGIIINLGKTQSTLEVGYYQYHETLVQNSAEDWMIDQMWPYIFQYASAKAFGTIGNEEEKARYYAEALRLLDGYHTILGDRVAHG